MAEGTEHTCAGHDDVGRVRPERVLRLAVGERRERHPKLASVGAHVRRGELVVADQGGPAQLVQRCPGGGDTDAQARVAIDAGGPVCARPRPGCRRGGAGDDYLGTVFDDGASLAIADGAAPFDDSFRPEQPLSTATGQPVAGTWSLTVYDAAGGDTGTVQSFELALCVTP